MFNKVNITFPLVVSELKVIYKLNFRWIMPFEEFKFSFRVLFINTELNAFSMQSVFKLVLSRTRYWLLCFIPKPFTSKMRCAGTRSANVNRQRPWPAGSCGCVVSRRSSAVHGARPRSDIVSPCNHRFSVSLWQHGRRELRAHARTRAHTRATTCHAYIP